MRRFPRWIGPFVLLSVVAASSVSAQPDNPWLEEIDPSATGPDALAGPPQAQPENVERPQSETVDSSPAARASVPPPPGFMPVSSATDAPTWLKEVALSVSDSGRVRDSFDAYRDAVRGGRPLQVQRAAAKLEEDLRNLGVLGVPGGLTSEAVAHALLFEAKQRNARGDPEGAVESIGLAKRVAPVDPEVHFALAEVMWSGMYDVVGTCQALWDAAVAAVRHPSYRTALVAVTSMVAIVAWMLTLVLVSLVMLARAFRYLVFDFHNALPRGAARWQLTTLTVLLAVVPVVVGAGPILTSLWWLTLSWAYLTRRERIALGLYGGLAALVPFAVSFVAALWGAPQSEMMRANRAMTEMGADLERAVIAKKSPGAWSALELAALAAADKREGRLEQAYERWRRLARENRDQSWVHNNLGVVAALMGREAHAEAELQAAIEKDPLATEPLFNLSLLQMRNGRSQKGAQLLDDVVALDPPALELYRTITFKRPDEPISHNRAFIDAVPPTPQPWSITGTSNGREIASEVGAALYFGLPPSIAAAGFTLFLLLWAGLARWARWLQPSHPCVRCGAAASRRYDAKEVPHDTCSACFHVFLAQGKRVETTMRTRKERQVASYQRARRRWTRTLGLLWPGLGHLYAGAPVLAVLLAWTFAFLGVTIVALVGPFPWPCITVSASRVVVAPLAVTTVILWAVTLRHAARRAK